VREHRPELVHPLNAIPQTAHERRERILGHDDGRPVSSISSRSSRAAAHRPGQHHAAIGDVGASSGGVCSSAIFLRYDLVQRIGQRLRISL